MRIQTQSFDTFITITKEGRINSVYATTLHADMTIGDKVVRRVMLGFSMADRVGTVIIYSEPIGEWELKDFTEELVKEIDATVEKRKEDIKRMLGIRILDGVIE